MSSTLEKLKSSRYYGYLLLAVMLLFFYGVFKILTPDNFGSPANLYAYLQSSIIYSVGGCGLYFIVAPTYCIGRRSTARREPKASRRGRRRPSFRRYP